MKNKKFYFLFILAAIFLFPSCEEEKVDDINNVYSDTETEHQYVDLGLPSGTLWATTNVGATEPHEYGCYYAWGETEVKNIFEWTNYKHIKAGETSWRQINKYNANDGLTTLVASDDAATVNWGSKWKTPTSAQWNELRTECTWRWTTSYNLSHIAGYIVTSKTDESKYIFLPAAGYCIDTRLRYVGKFGSYWSSSLRNAERMFDASDVSFSSDVVGKHTDLRFMGYTIRPVYSK